MTQASQRKHWRDSFNPSWLLRPTRQFFLGYTCARAVVDVATGAEDPRVVAMGVGFVVSVLYFNEALRVGMTAGNFTVKNILPVRSSDLGQADDKNIFYDLAFKRGV